jgi:L-methionine (R)-S-oxide reductase
MSKFPALLDEIDQLARDARSVLALQKGMLETIARSLSYYNWIGFYMLDREDSAILVLGPFYGEPTPHERIPVTQGICGAAVRCNETIIVENIASDPRYLSCSLGTKSEIVAPIRTRGCVVGEIDVDSDRLNAFQLEDREFLERCAEIVGQFLDRTEKSDPN